MRLRESERERKLTMSYDVLKHVTKRDCVVYMMYRERDEKRKGIYVICFCERYHNIYGNRGKSKFDGCIPIYEEDPGVRVCVCNMSESKRDVIIDTRCVFFLFLFSFPVSVGVRGNNSCTILTPLLVSRCISLVDKCDGRFFGNKNE